MTTETFHGLINVVVGFEDLRSLLLLPTVVTTSPVTIDIIDKSSSTMTNLLHDNTILIVLLLISRQLTLLHIPALATLAQFLQPRNSLRELES